MKLTPTSSLIIFVCLFTLPPASIASELDDSLPPCQVDAPQQNQLHLLPADTGSHIGQHLKPKDVLTFYMTCKEANGQEGEKNHLRSLAIKMMKAASTIHPLKVSWTGDYVPYSKGGNFRILNDKFDNVEFLLVSTIGSIMAIGYLVKLISLLPPDSPIEKQKTYGMHNALYESLSTYDRAKVILGCSLYGAIFVLTLPRFIIESITFYNQQTIKEGISFWQKLIERRYRMTYDYLWVRYLSLRNTREFDSPIVKKLTSLNNSGVVSIDLSLKNMHPEEFKEIMSFSKEDKTIKLIDIEGSHVGNNCELISINTPATIFDLFCDYEDSIAFHIKLTRKLPTLPTNTQQENLK